VRKCLWKVPSELEDDAQATLQGGGPLSSFGDGLRRQLVLKGAGCPVVATKHDPIEVPGPGPPLYQSRTPRTHASHRCSPPPLTLDFSRSAFHRALAPGSVRSSSPNSQAQIFLHPGRSHDIYRWPMQLSRAVRIVSIMANEIGGKFAHQVAAVAHISTMPGAQRQSVHADSESTLQSHAVTLQRSNQPTSWSWMLETKHPRSLRFVPGSHAIMSVSV